MDLAKKHAPKRFDEMWQWPSPTLKVLAAEIERGRLQSPMLFQSDYGEGKTTLAQIIGRRACCRRTELHPCEPCGECEGCRDVRMYTSTTHSDFGYFEIDCTQFSAAQVREMICRESMGGLNRPSFGRWVICLDEIGRRDATYQRQLLKIVENVRAHVILCAGSSDSVDRALAERCVRRPLVTPTPQQCITAVARIAAAEHLEIKAGAVPLLVTRLGCNPRRILKTLATTASLANGTVGIEEVEIALSMYAG